MVAGRGSCHSGADTPLTATWRHFDWAPVSVRLAAPARHVATREAVIARVQIEAFVPPHATLTTR